MLDIWHQRGRVRFCIMPVKDGGRGAVRLTCAWGIHWL